MDAMESGLLIRGQHTDGRSLARRVALSLPLLLVFLAFPSLADDSTPWTLQGGLSGGQASAIALDPISANNIYALVPSQGIYRTTDGGAKWSLAYAGVDLLCLVIDPLQPKTLYAAASNNKVVKSVDGGSTWQDASTGIPLSTMDTGNSEQMTVDPVNEGTVYLITWNSGVYKSTDGGGQWHAINTGIDSHSSNDLIQPAAGIMSLTVDSANPQWLYLTATAFPDVGTGVPSLALAGVYKSVDGGGHWSQVLSGQETYGLAVQPGNDQNLFASTNDKLYISTDGGAHWSATDGLAFANVLLIDPSNAQKMWLGSSGSLEYSSDGGATWTDPTASSYPVNGLAIDPATGELYAASAGYGVSKSGDDGSTWTPIDDGIHDVPVNQILAGHDGALYLGTKSSGLFRSADAGATWIAIDNGLNAGVQTPAVQVVDDPAGSGLYLVAGFGTFYKSTDEGKSWSQFFIPNTRYFNAVALTPGKPSTIYAAHTLGIVKSTDGGTTWGPTGSGLPGHDDPISIAADPMDSTKVFVGMGAHGLYESTDGGAHWSHVASLDATSIASIAIDPAHSGTIYVSFVGPSTWGIARTTDGGTSWTVSNTGLDPSDSIDYITFDPADSSVLVATAPDSRHIYLSADAGADWVQISNVPLSAAVAGRVVRSSSSTKTPALATVSMDPVHKGMMYGADSSGVVYRLKVSDLVQTFAKSQLSSPPPASSSSGGGTFNILVILGLLGALGLRRHPKWRS